MYFRRTGSIRTDHVHLSRSREHDCGGTASGERSSGQNSCGALASIPGSNLLSTGLEDWSLVRRNVGSNGEAVKPQKYIGGNRECTCEKDSWGPRIAKPSRAWSTHAAGFVIRAAFHGAPVMGCSQTVFPPTMVQQTLTSRIFSAAIEKMSSLSRTMSASFPGVTEPFCFS
jgi:hypothetical protein